jgi:hypothetical protein
MTRHLAPSAPESLPLPTARRRFRPRAKSVLTATLLGVLLLAGIAATWASAAQARSGGYFGTSTAQLSTSTSALVTSEIEVGSSSGKPANPSFDVGDLARVRIRASSASGDRAVFIGIGPTDQVENYLRGASYDQMASYLTNPLRVTYTRSSGSGSSTPPAAQSFWAATATGAGAQTLHWNKAGGAWMAVAMNADGSPGVAVNADIGLRFGFLLPLGLGLLILDLMLGAAVITVRRRPARQSS